MRKALLPAALIVTAAFGPRQGNAVEFPCGVSQVSSAVASPIFWRVWENALDRALADFTSKDEPAAEAPGWQGEFAKAIVQMVLAKTFEAAWFTEPKNSCPIMSIPQYLVRRTVERQISAHAGAPNASA